MLPQHPSAPQTRPTPPEPRAPIDKTRRRFRSERTSLTLVLAALFFSGCGQTGAPLPPSLQLPTPVNDLAVNRIADSVILQWTMPRRTTDKLPLKGLQPVQICRRTAEGPCFNVGAVSYEPGKPASYEDTLPAELRSGSPQLLSYSLDVLSPHGRSAGASNIVYTAAGSAPPPFILPRGEITAGGVLLQWQPGALTGTEHKVTIERTLLTPPRPGGAAEKSEGHAASPLGANPAPAKTQTLVVRLPPGADPGRSLDSDAAFDQRYSYRISRIATVSVSGKSIDIAGAASGEIVVATKDVFPPAVPTGLAAVAATDEGAIDLSWSANTEPDLAGYAIYRAEAGGEATRISSTKPIDGPAFRDTTAQPGHEYMYSVTALDRDGNQSPRSTEVKETLPPKQ